MKRLLCIALVLVFLLPGCALHRKLFYSEAEMAEYNAKEQAKKDADRDEEAAIDKVFNLSSGNDKQEYGCQFIAIDTSSSMMGFTTSHDVSRALRKAKEIAVNKGGNAIRLIMSSTSFDSSSMTFEVYKCKRTPFDN